MPAGSQRWLTLSKSHASYCSDVLAGVARVLPIEKVIGAHA
jgi:hypothetical protein